MFYVLSAILLRITSNSYINVLQKALSLKGNKSSVINFYTYLGLSVLSLCILPFVSINLSFDLLLNFVCMGILGALGNYFIIKALSVGELSSLAPINSFKPVVALVIAYFYLKEIPALISFVGIILIVAGTFILHKAGYNNKKAVVYRIIALIFSGTEAVFIKKIILLTDIPSSFILWSLSGLLFSSFFLVNSKNNLKFTSYKELLLLILSVFIMQYSTNYVFSKINVTYALALFQLSTILSVFLGVNIFNEEGLKRKIIASIIMVIGAVIIILC